MPAPRSWPRVVRARAASCTEATALLPPVGGKMRRCLGLDLGTTNSALAIAGEDRSVTLAQFAHGGGVSDTFRSILYLHPEAVPARREFTTDYSPPTTP